MYVMALPCHLCAVFHDALCLQRPRPPRYRAGASLFGVVRPRDWTGLQPPDVSWHANHIAFFKAVESGNIQK